MKSFHLALSILCFLAISLPAYSAPSPFAGLTITRIVLKDDRGNPLTHPEQVNRLIGVKPGDPFSGPAIREGIALLYLMGTFKDIRVDGFPEDNGVRLEYTFFPITVVDK